MIYYFTFNYNKDPNDRRLYANDSNDPTHVANICRFYVEEKTKPALASCIKRLAVLPIPIGWAGSIKLSELQLK